MTVQDLMSEVLHLSLEERLQLLELLAHSLREEWVPEEEHQPSVARKPRAFGDASLYRADLPQHRLRGLLKADVPPPTDSELADSYTEHLLEKYT
jgi:hypothetical protein